MRKNFFGNQFENIFVASSTIRESFYGRGGDDDFTLYHHEPDGVNIPDLTDRFFGGSGDDTLELLSFSVTADGDNLSKYGQLSFDGGSGYDTVKSKVSAVMSGGSTLDLNTIETSVISVEHWFYDIVLNAVAGDGGVTIQSGVKDDTLNIFQQADASENSIRVDTSAGADSVLYTANADVSDLKVNTGSGKDYFEFNGNWGVTADITVKTGSGKDTVVINGSTIASPGGLDAVIKTGRGADTVVLEGMHSESLNAGGGSDDIYVLTGSFANAADTIKTGGGRDRLFVELDAYSTVAVVEDFSAAKDVFVFDRQESSRAIPRDTDVLFDRGEWEAAEEDRLFMDNSADKLYFGSNVLVEFTSDVELTAGNFTVGNWDY
ncbi:hypothetical protein [Leisingera sp. F5]|uniref:hypothetical protein n=1 Tax=Leisingera sp. F5 TaxID=1813816 RepID=UPI000B2B62B3|nr:hypothetical protein [Leisingera sp. F5]